MACVLANPLEILLARSRIDDQQVFVLTEAVDDHVIDECPFRIQHCRVLRLADSEAGGVVHGNMLYGRQGLRTGEPDVSHVADIKDAHSGADCHVLSDDSAAERGRIFNRHLPAIEFHHLCAHPAVEGVQRSFTDGGRLNRRQNRPQRAVAGCQDGVTDYRNTRFFDGSNTGEACTRGERARSSLFAVLRRSGFFYRPNCTVTRDPAGTWVPAAGVCWRAMPLPTGSSCRPISWADSTAPRTVLPMNEGTSMPPCSTSSTTVPLAGIGGGSEDLGG